MSSSTTQPAPSPLRRDASRARVLIAPAFLAGLCIAAYAGGRHDQLFYDSVLMMEKPRITDVSDAARRFWSTLLLPGQQLSELTFAFNRAFNVWWGRPALDGRSFFAVNLLFHILNVWLLLALLRNLAAQLHWPRGARSSASLIAAALFAVHPLHVTGVDYAVQCRGLLAVLFYLLGLWCYLRLRVALGRPRRVLWGLAVFACCCLSAKSKSMGLTLPLAVLVLHLALAAREGISAKRVMAWCGAVAVAWIAIVLALLSAWGLLDSGTPAFFGGWSRIGEHLLTESRAFAHYWLLILWPAPRWMSVDHAFSPSHRLLDPGVLASLGLHSMLIAGAIVLIKRRCTVAGFGILLFYIALIPYAALPQPEWLVEYKTYLSAAGAALVLAELLMRVETRVPAMIRTTAALIVAAALMTLTVRRNELFTDPVRLWRDVTVKYPDHARGYINLGTALYASGKTGEALNAYNQAVRMDPADARLRQALGLAHHDLGNLDEAILCLTAAVELSGGRLDPRAKLADLLAKRGRIGEAIAQLQAGLRAAGPREDPQQLGEAHFYLARAFEATGRLEESIRQYEMAVHVAPEFFEARAGLGMLLSRMGRPGMAISQYRKALRLRPDSLPVQRALDDALQRRKASTRPQS